MFNQPHDGSASETSIIISREKASDFIIRKANQEDLAQLAEVLTKSFHSREGLNFWFYYLLKLGIYEDLRYRLRHGTPHYTCLVATTGLNEAQAMKEYVVGTVEIALRREYCWSSAIKESPYISNLAVQDAYRRLGIAGKLLNKCEILAREWGFQKIYLHVLENNHQAKQLYLNKGYGVCRIEFSFGEWLFHRPRRLLLVKNL